VLEKGDCEINGKEKKDENGTERKMMMDIKKIWR
jgi:hypothetical protein